MDSRQSEPRIVRLDCYEHPKQINASDRIQRIRTIHYEDLRSNKSFVRVFEHIYANRREHLPSSLSTLLT